MKNKKQVSKRTYNILMATNAILLIITILMFLAGLGGEGYWIHFGITLGVYIIWCFVFSKFTLNDEDKKKNELKQEDRRIKMLISEHVGYANDAFLTEERKRVEENGFVLCNKKTVNELVKQNSFSKCPICDAQVSQSNEYAASVSVVQKEIIDGVYVGATPSGLVKPAYQYVTVTKEFPAVQYHCPHCEWELFITEYETLELQQYDSKFSDGESYVREGYLPATHTAKYFYKGKLYDKINPEHYSLKCPAYFHKAEKDSAE